MPDAETIASLDDGCFRVRLDRPKETECVKVMAIKADAAILRNFQKSVLISRTRCLDHERDDLQV